MCSLLKITKDLIPEGEYEVLSALVSRAISLDLSVIIGPNPLCKIRVPTE